MIDKEEARMLMEAGVDYLGLPLRLPVNKEDLMEEEAVDVIKTITQPHCAVLIIYLEIHPAGVDAHTGVEAPNGKKDYDPVKKFVEESQEGFALIG